MAILVVEIDQYNLGDSDPGACSCGLDSTPGDARITYFDNSFAGRGVGIDPRRAVLDALGLKSSLLPEG